jgi:hypothetical protein
MPPVNELSPLIFRLLAERFSQLGENLLSVLSALGRRFLKLADLLPICMGRFFRQEQYSLCTYG